MKKSRINMVVSGMIALALLSGCAKENTSPSPAASEVTTETGVEATEATSEAASETEENAEIQPRTYDNPYQGMKFTLPAIWYTGVNEKQNIIFESYEYGLNVSYLSTEGLQIMADLQESISKLPEDATSYTDEQNDMIDAMYQQMFPIGLLLLEYDGNKESELRGSFTDAKELGEADLTTYSLLYNQSPDLSAMAEEDRKEYQAIWEAMFKIEEDITFSGYKSMEQLTGDIQFDSNTVAGLPIDTSIFIPFKLTAVNIWATWCNPCVNEMPELQEVYESLPEGVNLLGVCIDAAEEPELAQQIVEKTGVKYESIVANEEMTKGFLSYIQAYPTTIFVDSEGNLVGEPLEGAPPSEVTKAYLEAIDEHLKLLEE